MVLDRTNRLLAMPLPLLLVLWLLWRGEGGVSGFTPYALPGRVPARGDAGLERGPRLAAAWLGIALVRRAGPGSASETAWATATAAAAARCGVADRAAAGRGRPLPSLLLSLSLA